MRCGHHVRAFWRSYFAGADARISGCRLDHSQNSAFFSCRVVSFSTTPIADAYLFRTGRCDYGYLIDALDGSHRLHGWFGYCG
jgi:hypothetical protein